MSRDFLRSPLVGLLACLLALVVAMGVGRFSLTPQLPHLIREGQLDLTGAGLLAAANYLGYLVGALDALFAREARQARLRLLVGLWACFGLTLASVWAEGFWPHALLRFGLGVASAWVLIMVTALSQRLAAESGRARLGALVFAGPGIGVMVTGLLAALGNALGQDSVFIWKLFADLALVLILMLLPLLPRPPAAAPAPAKVEEQARPPVAVPSSPPPSPPPAPAAAPRAAMAAADKLDGADIYIAYGRYGQARDLLRQVLAEQPQRLSARMKLLLVLAELGDAAGFDALAEETLASGGNPEAIDELRGRYPALLQMPATETPAATKDDDWSDLPLAEPPAAQQPDATSGADGFGDLNLDLDLDWGALENPLDNPDLPRRAAAGKAEPAEEEPLAFESNLHELPDVAEYEHLELDQPEPATVPPEEASASLDRARACIDSGDLDQASRILRLVVAHGDPWQKAEARELLALIA
ncbi:YbfB/YjiJ family MFS transporter [Pseudomonas aeruginosa]